jgi:hypothetical protein
MKVSAGRFVFRLKKGMVPDSALCAVQAVIGSVKYYLCSDIPGVHIMLLFFGKPVYLDTE